MMFREALKTGFYDLQTARDEYRVSCGSAGMHRDLLWRYMDVQTKLITPICPHYAEHVWTDVLGKKGFAIKAGFPSFDAPNLTLQRANKYLQNVIVDFRKVLQKQTAPPKKAKRAEPAASGPKPSIGLIFVEENYGGWQEECLKILEANYNSETKTFKPLEEILAALKSSPIAKMGDSKRILGQCMPFIKFKQDETKAVGPHALDLRLPFGEFQVLEENSNLITRQLGLDSVSVHRYTDAEAVNNLGPHLSLLKQSPPSPGRPSVVFVAAATVPPTTVGA
jgi:leucyl-tRNA synthetase